MSDKLKKILKENYLTIILGFLLVLGGGFFVVLAVSVSKNGEEETEYIETSLVNDQELIYSYVVETLFKKNGSVGWIRTCLLDRTTRDIQKIYLECSPWEEADFLKSVKMPQKFNSNGEVTEIDSFGGFDMIPFVDLTGDNQKVRQILLNKLKEEENDIDYWTRVCDVDLSGDSIYGVKDWSADCGEWSATRQISQIGLLPERFKFSGLIDFVSYDFSYIKEQGIQRAFFAILSLNKRDFTEIEFMSGKFIESSNFENFEDSIHEGEGPYWQSFPGLYSAHGAFSYLFVDNETGVQREKVVEKVISLGGTRLYGRVCDIDNTNGAVKQNCKWEDNGVLEVEIANQDAIESFGGYGAYTFNVKKKMNLN